jgi:hypothetical protein
MVLLSLIFIAASILNYTYSLWISLQSSLLRVGPGVTSTFCIGYKYTDTQYTHLYLYLSSREITLGS